MVSTVPDEKCDQSNMRPVNQTLTVHLAPSLDGCRSELNNFGKDTEDQDIELGQQITFRGSHLNVFQNWSYDSISNCLINKSSLESGYIFQTAYTFTVKKDGAVYDSFEGMLPSNNEPRKISKTNFCKPL